MATIYLKWSKFNGSGKWQPNYETETLHFTRRFRRHVPPGRQSPRWRPLLRIPGRAPPDLVRGNDSELVGHTWSQRQHNCRLLSLHSCPGTCLPHLCAREKVHFPWNYFMWWITTGVITGGLNLSACPVQYPEFLWPNISSQGTILQKQTCSHHPGTTFSPSSSSPLLFLLLLLLGLFRWNLTWGPLISPEPWWPHSMGSTSARLLAHASQPPPNGLNAFLASCTPLFAT